MENTNGENTQAQGTGDDTGAQAQDGSGSQRTFTQEEVNSLIQARLARAKEQAGKDAKAEYDQKMADLQARELKLIMKEKLDAREMPRGLVDILSCTSEEDIDSKLDALQKIYGTREAPRDIKVGAPSGFKFGAPAGPDPVRKAMGLER